MADIVKPPIVCLCGSMRFYETFMWAMFNETMAGKIVLGPAFFPGIPDSDHSENVGITPEQKVFLDELHLRKIELADVVFILNEDGYIGESTARELEYARSLGKVIRFLEEERT